MKKILPIIVAISLIGALAGCGNKQEGGGDVKFESAEEMLSEIYDEYAEGDKFPIAGGDSSNVNMDEPGEFDTDNIEELDVMLGVPADAADMIDDAASMVHMMNANTFTCGAFHLENEDDKDAFIESVKENILARQWICGMPDTLIIATADDGYVVAAFGEAQIMDTFKENITKLGIIISEETPVLE